MSQELDNLRAIMVKLEQRKADVQGRRDRAVRRAQEQADTSHQAIEPLAEAVEQGRGGWWAHRALVTAQNDHHRLRAILADHETS